MPRVAKKKSGKTAGSVGETDRTATVQSLRDLMREFVAERKWTKFHSPRNLAASISIEAAELLEHYQWLTHEDAIHKSIHDNDFRREVGEEMADVFLYLISLANTLKLDISQTIHAKMAKNRLKYPAERFQGHYHKPLTEDRKTP